MHLRYAGWLACLAMTLSLAAVEGGQEAMSGRALPLGSVETFTISSEQPGAYEFTADVAGLLTVAVRNPSSDLWISVTDDVGQTVPDGRSDRDLGGSGGAEQLVVTLATPGRYQVLVDSYDAINTQVELTAAWLPFPSVSVAPDPDGRPTNAMPLGPGTSVQDSLDSTAGDYWDWFSITLSAAAVVTVVVEAPEGDLVLEHFDGDNFREAVTRADEDMGGVRGNETITFRSESGGTYYLRVTTALALSGDAMPYRIRVGAM